VPSGTRDNNLQNLPASPIPSLGQGESGGSLWGIMRDVEEDGRKDGRVEQVKNETASVT